MRHLLYGFRKYMALALTQSARLCVLQLLRKATRTDITMQSADKFTLLKGQQKEGQFPLLYTCAHLNYIHWLNKDTKDI